MWLILGTGAIIFAVANVMRSLKHKDSNWFGFASLSLTALTVCAFYSDGAARVAEEDWGGLMDIMPTASKCLWFCTVASILINFISVYRKK